MTNLLLDIAVPTDQGRALFDVRPAALVATATPTALPFALLADTVLAGEGESVAAELEPTSPDVLTQPLVVTEVAIEIDAEDLQLPVAVPTSALASAEAPMASTMANTMANVGETRLAAREMNIAATALNPALGRRLVPVAQLETQAAMNVTAGANAAVLVDVAQAQELARGTAATGVGRFAGSELNVEVAGIERSFAKLAANTTNALDTATFSTQAAQNSEVSHVFAAKPAPTAEVQRPALATLLGERLQVQIERRAEQATVRLDPPSLGSIEIVVRHEAGSIQVQLRATNGEVARQLHAIGETLRQDLSQRQQAEVSVQVWDGAADADGRQRHKQEQQWPQEPGRALGAAASEHTSVFALDTE